MMKATFALSEAHRSIDRAIAATTDALEALQSCRMASNAADVTDGEQAQAMHEAVTFAMRRVAEAAETHRTWAKVLEHGFDVNAGFEAPQSAVAIDLGALVKELFDGHVVGEEEAPEEPTP